MLTLYCSADEKQKLYNGYTYVQNEGGVTIVKYKGTDTDLVIPADIDGTPVTKLRFDAFTSCRLSSVTIPASVYDIGENASMSGAVNKFCDSLSSVNVDAGNSYYRSLDGVLYSSDMSTLLFYPRTKTDSVFAVPDSVVYIMRYAFEGSAYLTSVSMNANVAMLGSDAFASCTALRTAYLSPTVNLLPDGLFDGCTSLIDVMLPSGLSAVGEGAFKNCSSLAMLTLPESVVSVASGAFAGCSSMSALVVLGTLGTGGADTLLAAFSGFTGMSEGFRIYLSDGSVAAAERSGKIIYIKQTADTEQPEETTAAPVTTTAAEHETNTEQADTVPETEAHTMPELTSDPEPKAPVWDPAMQVDAGAAQAFVTIETTAAKTTRETTTVTTKAQTTLQTQTETSEINSQTSETGTQATAATTAVTAAATGEEDNTLVWILGGVTLCGLAAAAVYLTLKKRAVRR